MHRRFLCKGSGSVHGRETVKVFKEKLFIVDFQIPAGEIQLCNHARKLRIVKGIVAGNPHPAALFYICQRAGERLLLLLAYLMPLHPGVALLPVPECLL